MMEQMDFKDLPQITNLEQDECNKLGREGGGREEGKRRKKEEERKRRK